MRDLDIRRALHSEMQRIHMADPDTKIVEELGLCQGIARIDLAVVNGTLHGYEIKSEHDTLARLPLQRNTYDRALELISIVCGPTYQAKIAEYVSPWWGIWIATEGEGRVELRKIRGAAKNPTLDAYAVAQLLWREEALNALTDRGLDAGLRSKRRGLLWERLVSALSVDELTAIVRECLKQRVPLSQAAEQLT